MAGQYRLDVKEPKLVCLIILSAFASMGAVLMTPALPDIVRFFHITQGKAQLTVTLFLVGYAIGQLIYGPMANRYGRKPTFYIGIAVATIGSIFSILSSPAHSFNLLLAGRMLEALGSSVGLVISFTIISDFYYPDQSRRIMSYMMMAFAIVPGVAVFIGGFIAQYLNWESCFYFLLIYGIVLIYPAYILPETISEVDKYAMKVARIRRSYGEVFRNFPLVRYSLLFGFSVLLPYVFSAEGPFIGIHTLGFSASVYGMLAILPSMGMLVGSILSARATQRFSARMLIYIGILFEAIGAIGMLLSFLWLPLSLITLLTAMFFIYLGHAFVSGNASSSAMYFAVDKANGSAVMSFLCMLMSVFGTLLLAVIPSHSALVMPALFIVAIAVVFIFQLTLKRQVIA